MQNAKDSFFITLRNRLASLNPTRTITVRGVVRPAVLVAENELPEGEGDPLDCFVLRWQESAVDTSEPLPLQTLQGSIRYATQGTRAMAGMDRGRILAAMDGELRDLLMPAFAAKENFTTNPASTMASAIFWSALAAGAAVLAERSIERTVTLTLFVLQEAGEA